MHRGQAAGSQISFGSVVNASSGMSFSRGIVPVMRKIVLILLLLAIALPAAAEQKWNPRADPKAVVVEGSARFTVLTPRLVRMEWAGDGKFEDHASLVFVNRRLPRRDRAHAHGDVDARHELA